MTCSACLIFQVVWLVRHFKLALVTDFSCYDKMKQFLALSFNTLPNDKILDWSKLKAFADDKINAFADEKLKYVLERSENIVGKGENAGYQHFHLFPQCCQKTSYTGSLKVEIVW